MDVLSQTTRHNRLNLTRHQNHSGASSKGRDQRRRNPLAFPDATPTKRIATAAGQRLEEVIGVGNSGTKEQGNWRLRSDSQTRFLSTSRYLSLLSEGSSEAEVHDVSKTRPECLPRETTSGRLEDNALCKKIETEGKGLFRRHFRLSGRHKRLAIIIPVIFALVVGLVVGLAVGLVDAGRE